jgi:hypothetical protein
MGPLVEAMMVFVGIPALILAAVAGLTYGTVAMVRRLTASEPVLDAAKAAEVVVFPVLQSADDTEIRRAA